MHQALYRKWRPKTFSDVIGQSHITETLRRQVAEGRTSHAYLFTGTRGTGKTTCAKILAKAVNCEHPVNGDPCGQCPSCVGIDKGDFLDVWELDAASNNGVDQVRELRSKAIYSPAQVKKRVYIIDEVHMLTDAAFNALLKILEEPPEHLMFILATTELHKVLPTVLSRCQRYSFRRIQPRDIAKRLLYVAKQEGIQLTADGAELLSRLSDGALRDGLSLLDQCAAIEGTIDAAAVLEVLGLAGNLQTAQLMEHILNRDAQSALLLLDRLYDGGKDMGAVLSELSALTRDLLLHKTAPRSGDTLLSGGFDTAALDRLSQNVPGNRFLYLASTLQQAAAELYNSSNRRMDTELCLLRLCDESLSGDLSALDARLQKLEDQFAARAEIARAVPLQPVVPPSGAPVVKAAAVVPPKTELPKPVSRARKPVSGDDWDYERPPLPEEPPERETAIQPEPPKPVARAQKPVSGDDWDYERPPLPEEPPERDAVIWPEPPKASSRARKPVFDDDWDYERPPLPEEAPPVPFEPGERIYDIPDEFAQPPAPRSHPASPPRRSAGPADAKETIEAKETAEAKETEEAKKAKETAEAKETEEAKKAKETEETKKAKKAKKAAPEPEKPEPAEEPEVEAAPLLEGNWWRTLVENSKNRLPPMYRSFLGMCGGVLEKGVLAVYTPDSVVAGRLDNDRVRSVLGEEMEQLAGVPVRLVFREGAIPSGVPEENRRRLLEFGSQFDNIHIDE